MNNSNKKPCYPQYSTGGGTGVAEILGNWGLSQCKINRDHANIRRLKDIYLQMDKLKTTKNHIQVVYNRKNDPESWFVPPSPPESRPPWTHAENRPLITFTTSTINRIPVFSYRSVRNELKNPAPGREYYEQGTDKWYKAHPIDSYQTTCCPSTASGHSCTPQGL